jgi:endonuclease/exonuclease/phosphatase family metal-dependent hydrolase
VTLWVGLLLVPGVYALVTERLGRCDDRVTAGLQLLLPWWAVVAAVVAVIAVGARDLRLATASALVVVAIGAVIVPKVARRRREQPLPKGALTTFSVGLANLYLDNPAPADAARQLLAAAPAILVLAELTPRLLAAFDAAGGAARYPHRVHREPLRGEYEAGIFSVYPFARSSVHAHGPLCAVDAVVSLPEGEVRVIATHPEAPTTRAGFRLWRAQLAALRSLLADAGPATVALGDLNAGTLQPPYEALLTTSFRDAHDVVGSSLAPSWGVAPSLPRWVPTFAARLDHLLVGPAIRVIEVHDLDPVGSDHRPFVAGLALAR